MKHFENPTYEKKKLLFSTYLQKLFIRRLCQATKQGTLRSSQSTLLKLYTKASEYIKTETQFIYSHLKAPHAFFYPQMAVYHIGNSFKISSKVQRQTDPHLHQTRNCKFNFGQLLIECPLTPGINPNIKFENNIGRFHCTNKQKEKNCSTFTWKLDLLSTASDL